MRTVAVLFVALALASCAPSPPLPNPTSRAEACARIDGPTTLGGNSFCRVGGALCDPLRGDVRCIELNPGEQPVCVPATSATVPPTTRALYSCGPNNTPCLPWWECRQWEPRPGRVEYGCFPGPPCDSTADAGVDGG